MKAADATGRAPRRQHDGVDGGGPGRGPDPDPPERGAPRWSGRSTRGPPGSRTRCRSSSSRSSPDPNQPRKEFDPEALAELAASLKARGQLQPIRVRWDEGPGKWVIIAGERRYRAALLAGPPDARLHRGDEAPDRGRDPGGPARGELPPRRPEAGRAGQGVPDADGPPRLVLPPARRGAQPVLGPHHSLHGPPEPPEDLQEQVDLGTVPASAAAEVAKIEDDAARRDLVGKIAAGELTRDETVREVRRATNRVPRSGAGKGRGGAPEP